MSNFSNTPDRYRPTGPSEPLILDVSEFDHLIEERDQLFYRQDQIALEQLAGEILADPSQASITTYQYWAETGWKTEHGTYKSVLRFSEKVREEYEEFAEVFQAHNGTIDHHELIAEAGDVLWCLSALSSNGGVSIDAHLKTLLYSYVRGIAHMVGNQKTPPVWRPQAAALASKWEALTVQDLTNLVRSNFEPTPSPVMNVDADEFFDEPLRHVWSLGCSLQAITFQHDRQYGYNDKPTLVEEFNLHGQVLGDLAARSVLDLVFIVHHLSSGEVSFADVIEHNVQKISARINQQLVDKSDGKRSDDLL